ncbi:hypothetical protein BV22DRAFT_1050331 [Leucogyrophana mollusca]|uniref:Uncharacterized protein n=1 Tax=Leucogyrophana mollusca TaxID=85980 RepID=A0ACB8B5B6_9AGAM|nr:hypothetical protein BV22DRAFT_1050331 [Leucogyrophana mollusca]
MRTGGGGRGAAFGDQGLDLARDSIGGGCPRLRTRGAPGKEDTDTRTVDAELSASGASEIFIDSARRYRGAVEISAPNPHDMATTLRLGSQIADHPDPSIPQLSEHTKPREGKRTEQPSYWDPPTEELQSKLKAAAANHNNTSIPMLARGD